ncbi:hypothetical protein BGW38_005787, partial [Lunasporangiospora selenospora]
VTSAYTEPITVVFDSYNEEHNCLEFKQYPSTSTLARMDLNIWEHQTESTASHLRRQEHEPAQLAGVTRTRRSSITQAGIVRTTEHQLEQELRSMGPITPLSNTGPVRNTLSSALVPTPSPALADPGSSSSVPAVMSPSLSFTTSATTTSSQDDQTNESYMARFARRVLGETGYESAMTNASVAISAIMNQNTVPLQTRPGMDAVRLAEEARRLFYTVEKDVLPKLKQYKLDLTEGSHYFGDDDFVAHFTIGFEFCDPPNDLADEVPSEVAFVVRTISIDYIRVAWKWILAGANGQRVETVNGPSVDPLTVDDPMPNLRMGRIYAERFNRVLREIKNQDTSRYIRGELALLGYDASMIPRDYISVNMRSEPVLAWVARDIEKPLMIAKPSSSLLLESLRPELEEKSSSQKLRSGPQTPSETMEVLLEHGQSIVAAKSTGKTYEAVSHEENGDFSDSDWEDVAAESSRVNARHRVRSPALASKESSNNDCERTDLIEATLEEVAEDAAAAAKVAAAAEAAAAVQEEDEEILQRVVSDMKQNLGYLCARDILEEMLVVQGYARELVWKYGVVRRELMNTVPEPGYANQALQKIIKSEEQQK